MPNSTVSRPLPSHAFPASNPLSASTCRVTAAKPSAFAAAWGCSSRSAASSATSTTGGETASEVCTLLKREERRDAVRDEAEDRGVRYGAGRG